MLCIRIQYNFGHLLFFRFIFDIDVCSLIQLDKIFEPLNFYSS